MSYEVVHCNECGKPIKSAPSWLSNAKVCFICETCRQKHPKALGGFDPAAIINPTRDEDEVAEDIEIINEDAEDAIDPDDPTVEAAEFEAVAGMEE